MTAAQFDNELLVRNGTQRVRQGDRDSVREQAAHKDELERAIKLFLETGKIKNSD